MFKRVDVGVYFRCAFINFCLWHVAIEHAWLLFKCQVLSKGTCLQSYLYALYWRAVVWRLHEDKNGYDCQGNF